MFLFQLKKLILNGRLFLILLLSIFSTTMFAQQPGDAWGFVCAFPQGGLLRDRIYQFDKITGDATLIGRPNCGNLLTGEFVDGVYYAMDSNRDRLVSVAADGSCTVIGNASFNDTPSGLSHDMTTGITYLMSTNSTRTSLYTIDLSTGVTTLVGTNNGGGISLIIDGQGNAYQVDLTSDRINRLNLNTAAVTQGPRITRNGVRVDISFAQDLDADCDDATGDLIGIIYSGGGTGRLGTLNPTTGVFTQRDFIGAEICGFSVNNLKPAPEPLIPTMSQWGLMIFGLLVLNMGVIFVQRRKLI